MPTAACGAVHRRPAITKRARRAQKRPEGTTVKYVYFFGAGKAEGTGNMREVLGGKGAGLAEMTRIGLPVPAGFTITTECCDYYLKHDLKYPKSLRAEGKKNLAHLEKATKKKL